MHRSGTKRTLKESEGRTLDAQRNVKAKNAHLEIEGGLQDEDPTEGVKDEDETYTNVQHAISDLRRSCHYSSQHYIKKVPSLLCTLL